MRVEYRQFVWGALSHKARLELTYMYVRRAPMKVH